MPCPGRAGWCGACRIGGYGGGGIGGNAGCGGGGGYSGGGSNFHHGGNGGGGGSYNTGTNQNNISGVQSGNGLVIISYSTQTCTGCTDPAALNYDSLALYDDGSCIICDLTTSVTIMNATAPGACDGFVFVNATSSYSPVNFTWYDNSGTIISSGVNFVRDQKAYLDFLKYAKKLAVGFDTNNENDYNQKKENVAVCFFGDGAANEGNFHEGLNFASILNLPVIFVCENNHYAEATPVEYAVSITDIADRASSYSMPGVVVDGMDVFAVYDAAGEAVKRARNGEGPSLLELKTYRYHGHFHADVPENYRTKNEETSWKDRDPIETFRNRKFEN